MNLCFNNPKLQCSKASQLIFKEKVFLKKVPSWLSPEFGAITEVGSEPFFTWQRLHSLVGVLKIPK